MMVRGSDTFLLPKKAKIKTGLRQLYIIAYPRPVKLQKQSREAYGLKPQRLFKKHSGRIIFLPIGPFRLFCSRQIRLPAQP